MTVIPQEPLQFAHVPDSDAYVLADCSVPRACLRGADWADGVSADDLLRCNIHIQDGRIRALTPVSEAGEQSVVRLDGACVFPAFVDLHTHIDKGHTCERSRNPTGNLTGADSSTARDASFWDIDDVFWRMDFSVRCAYAHGTCALRTHLINMTEKQTELTWPAFAQLRTKWRGKVELQGVALVALSYFRDRGAAERLARTVAAHGGVLGAAVCCTHHGGLPADEWTTCEGDRDALLDTIFELAAAHDLLLDFHVDENGNEQSKGLRHIARKTLQHGYQGRVVCGHCCSLAWQSAEDLRQTVALTAEAGITVVSLPLVNEWTQDRQAAGRTPRWRGITALHELQDAGVATALASDNTRDQFYQYGDLDMLEVFTQGVRLGQLDRPIGAWPGAVAGVPAAAMHLPRGVIEVGAAADLVLFRARKYSELLSRPQHDRVVIRDGRAIAAVPPDYRLLDYDTENREYFYAKMRSEAAPRAAPQPIPQAPCLLGQGASGSRSGLKHSVEGARSRIVRGLSAVLPSEAVSSPPTHEPFPTSKLLAGTVRSGAYLSAGWRFDAGMCPVACSVLLGFAAGVEHA